MNLEPLAAVTVVVASYNHAEFVEQALASVFAQTEPRVRVIITDDASNDGSQQLIRDLLTEHGWVAEHLVFHDQNQGICRTFNEALALVQTPFVAFISADDWMHPDRMLRQLEHAQQFDESVAVFHTDMQIAHPDGSLHPDTWRERVPLPEWAFEGATKCSVPQLLDVYSVRTPSAMLRTAAVREVGGYDETLSFEDLDMWLRLAEHYQFAYLDEALAVYRVGMASQLSERVKVRPGATDEYLRILEKHLRDDDADLKWLEHRIFKVARSAFHEGALSRRDAMRWMRPLARRRLFRHGDPRPMLRVLAVSAGIARGRPTA